VRKRTGCALLALALAIAAGVGAAVVYARSERRVRSTASEARFAVTPERLARGKHLYEMACSWCHGAEGAAEREFRLPLVRSWAANITADPATGLGAWTDGQIEESIRRGVRCTDPTRRSDKPVKDARILRPPMPAYTRLSDEDAAALVVYLRSLAPVSKVSPPAELTVAGRIAFAFAKKPVHQVPRGVAEPVPDRQGEYLAREVARCADCHARDGRWAGGERLEEVGLTPVLASNLTPDEVEGIGRWSEAQLGAALRLGTSASGRTLHAAMPRYELSPGETAAVWSYLRTQAPVRAHVWSPEALQGLDLYARIGCASCHGFDGRGPRADLTKLGAAGDVGRIKATIKDPTAVKPDAQMPRLGVEDDKDLEALARYIIELARRGP
jgi:mono/diheme cytochrome c family protein